MDCKTRFKQEKQRTFLKAIKIGALIAFVIWIAHCAILAGSNAHSILMFN